MPILKNTMHHGKNSEERHYGNNKKTTWRIFNAPSLYQGEGKDTDVEVSFGPCRYRMSGLVNKVAKRV